MNKRFSLPQNTQKHMSLLHLCQWSKDHSKSPQTHLRNHGVILDESKSGLPRECILLYSASLCCLLLLHILSNTFWIRLYTQCIYGELNKFQLHQFQGSETSYLFGRAMKGVSPICKKTPVCYPCRDHTRGTNHP